MGLFDTVRFEYPLPNPEDQDRDYQTKDLDCVLQSYTVTRDGRLVQHPHNSGLFEGPTQDTEWAFHGDISVYDSEEIPGAERRWIEYIVRFTNGRVQWVRPRAAEDSDEEASIDQRSDAALTGLVPSLWGRPLTVEEFAAQTPEKLELVDGHIPGEDELLRLLLVSLGLRRVIAAADVSAWRRALEDT